jgi:hypothetical protein
VKAAPAKPAGYSGTPLPKKLGIKEGTQVALIGAPTGFSVGELPLGAVVRRGAKGKAELTLWFVRSVRELMTGARAMVPRSEGSGLWIVWAKQTSPLASDVTETDVRRVALAAGMVDFKVCAVDDDWSGLRFNRRKSA